MVTPTLGFALIGCGGMGRSEAKLLSQIPEARLVTVCDVQPQAAEAFGQAMGVPAITDPAAALADPSVGAVMVTTPNTMHTQLVLDAAAAGKHIFCEKPMAMTVAECDRMIAAAKQHGVRLMVGHVLRLLPLFDRIVELFDSGVLGKPVAAQITRIGGFPEAVPAYRRTRGGAGGLLYDVTIHEVDLLHRLCGLTRSVYASMDRSVVQGIDYEDTLQLQLRFQSGAMASIFESIAATESAFTGVVIAERGTLQFNYRTGHLSYHTVGSAEPVNETVTAKDRENGYLKELRSFTEWVLYDRQPLLTAAEGRAAIVVAEAAYRSAETGQPVALEHR
jgi:predicted dehydrogenase